jgi:hypothetical protein
VPKITRKYTGPAVLHPLSRWVTAKGRRYPHFQITSNGRNHKVFEKMVMLSSAYFTVPVTEKDPLFFTPFL